MEAIRRHADGFPFWQRRKRFGRPHADERALLIAFMLQQLLGLTFRETEGLLAMVGDYYRIGDIPDHSTMCRRLSSKRNHVETVFSMIGSALGYRLRCRNRRSRENEVRCKLSLFNLIQLAMRREFWC